MKTFSHLLKTSIAASIICLALITISSSCKKNTAEPIPETKPVSEMDAKIDGISYKIAESGITGSLYTDSGDPVKAVEINAALDNSGKKLKFYLNELKSGKVTIEPKVGTSAAPAPRNLRVEGAQGGGTTTVLQNYVRYEYNGNDFYATSGYIEVNYDQALGKITASWSFTFSYANGTTFTSSGSFTIYIGGFITKPKTEVKDPTPVSTTPTIDNITPQAGEVGTEVAIVGTNFSTIASENVVRFNGIDAVVKSATATKLVVNAPQGGTTGAISVRVKNSEVAVGPKFSYVLPSTFTAMSVNSGKSGDVITLTGTNFSATASENIVLFTAGSSTTPAVVKTASTTSLTVEVPTTATTGPIAITVKGLASTPAASFNTTFTILTSQAITVTKITLPNNAELTGHSAMDNEGNLWVRTIGFDLLKYNTRGALLRTLKTSEYTQYGYFRNFCFDSNGNMYIAFNSNALPPYDQVVVKYDSDLNATVISGPGKLPGNFQGFNSFAAGSNGELYFDEVLGNIYTMNTTTGASGVFLTPSQLNNEAPKSISCRDNAIYLVLGNRVVYTSPKKTITVVANLAQGDKDGLLTESTTKFAAANVVRNNKSEFIVADSYNKIKLIDAQATSIITIAGNTTATALAGAGLATKVPVAMQLYSPSQANVLYSVPNASFVSSLNYFQIIAY